MATEHAGLCCPPAEFPDRWIAEGLRQPGEQTRTLGGDSGRQQRSIEAAFQTADCLRGRKRGNRARQAVTCDLWFVFDARKRGAELFGQGALETSKSRGVRSSAGEVA